MTDSPDSPDSPGHDRQPEQVRQPADHQRDGLDLARAAARAAARAGVTGRAVVRRRRGAAGPGGTGGTAGLGDSLARDRAAFRRRGGLSGPGPDERDPQPLGPVVENLVRRHGWETPLQHQGVFARWAELVGTEVADHCTPESLADGKLVVRTDSTAWATQLRLLAPTLVRRLNEQLGHGTVTVIDVLGPHLPSWRKGPRSVGGRGPRDTYG